MSGLVCLNLSLVAVVPAAVVALAVAEPAAVAAPAVVAESAVVEFVADPLLNSPE